jgi:hypothetical protein
MDNMAEQFGENMGSYKKINEKSLAELSRMVNELIVEIRQGASMMGSDGLPKKDGNDLKKINMAVLQRVSAMDKKLSNLTSVRPVTAKIPLPETQAKTSAVTNPSQTVQTSTGKTKAGLGGFFKRGPKK